jgi:hypothetical protein
VIVLRIEIDAKAGEVRWTGAAAVLGSAEGASIRRTDAGWAPREAVLHHLGTEVLLVRADGGGEVRLRVGDGVRLGAAEVTLVGLLPLFLLGDDAGVEDDAGRDSPPPAAPTADRIQPEPPQVAAARAPGSWSGFTLEGDVPARSAAPPKPPAAKPPPVPGATPPAPPTPEGAGATTAVSTSVTTPATAATTTSATPPAEEKAKPQFDAWHVQTFEGELFGALKRSPWFVLSAAIHGMLVFVLMLFSSKTPTAKPEEPLVVGTALGSPTSEAESADLLSAADAFGDISTPEPPAMPVLPEEDPFDDRPKTRESAGQATEEVLPPSDDSTWAPSSVVGTAPRSLAVRTRKMKSLSKTAEAIAAGSGEVNLDPDRALEVNRKAAAAIREQIRDGGGALGRALRGLRREHILVVRGAFDHMEVVLDELKIPYTIKSPMEVVEGYDFTQHRFLFWNCNEDSLPPRLRAAVSSSVREFVRAGGYLFCTDWSIENLLTHAFPGYVATSGRRQTLPEMVLDVAPVTGSTEHPLMDGVLVPGTQAKWWLESSSFDVQVMNRGEVAVLLESPTLAAPPFRRSPVVALTFPFGRGRVLHVMGHYYQQKGNLAGAIGVQRLPLNFIRMRMEPQPGDDR